MKQALHYKLNKKHMETEATTGTGEKSIEGQSLKVNTHARKIWRATGVPMTKQITSKTHIRGGKTINLRRINRQNIVEHSKIILNAQVHGIVKALGVPVSYGLRETRNTNKNGRCVARQSRTSITQRERK